MPQIVISDCDHTNVNAENEVFTKNGYNYVWLHCSTEEDVIRQCKGAVVILNQYAPMNEQVFRALPTLKCIVRYGVGVDNINIHDATRFGIKVCNVPDYGVNEVADHALALMLSLVRKINKMSSLTRMGIWDYAESIPIRRASEQTVGIVGVGRIGTAFAQRVQALKYKIVGCDIAYGGKGKVFPKFVHFISFEDLVKQSDIISIHCSLTDTTRHLFTSHVFDLMREGSYLINVARGQIVDEEALCQAILKGKIAGAGIDVIEKEPIDPASPLLSLPNVIVTPHMAWYSEDSSIELKRKCAEEAVRFLRGESVLYSVN